jgi:uncharacterized protein (TIGR03435 family)
MVRPRRRPFSLNVGGVTVVCLYIGRYDTVPIFAQSQMNREGNRRETVDTSPGRVTMRNIGLSSYIRWAYGVRGHALNHAERVSSEN